MEIVGYRSEVSTVRSEISNASSGYAFVTFPLHKSRLSIPEYEPLPDYSPENTLKLDGIDGNEVRQSLLQNQSQLSPQSTPEAYSSVNDNREPPRLCIQAQNVEVYHSPTSNNASMSPSSNRELLLHTSPVKETESRTCSCSKKCLIGVVAILGFVVVILIVIVIVLVLDKNDAMK